MERRTSDRMGDMYAGYAEGVIMLGDLQGKKLTSMTDRQARNPEGLVEEKKSTAYLPGSQARS